MDKKCDCGGKMHALAGYSGTVYEAQSYPEKSEETGIEILRRFDEL